MLSQHVARGWTLRSVGKRIADRMMPVARPSTATLVNVFMTHCNTCGLLKAERRLDQPLTECPLCRAQIDVLAHYRFHRPIRSRTAFG
jgi:hypothetical protein